MPIDDRTTNRSYKMPNAGNFLADDVVRLRDALAAIDADVFARYTKTEVDTLITNLIAGAPGALNTLDELAAALGDDANFAATVTNLLALKANIADVYTKAQADARYVQGSTQTEMVFIATASQSVFTLSTAVINKPSALVTVDGVVQPTSEYSINITGTQLTLSEGVPVGTVVRVLALGVASGGAPSDDTVTTAKLRDEAVTTAKLADGALAASTAGLAKMADGFLQATTAGLAKMADNFLAATTAGRAKMADLFVTTAKLNDAAVTPAKLSQPLTLATAQNSTSGTSIDFTGIPSWVKRVTVMFNGVSTSGVSNKLIQLGTTSGFTSTGYTSSFGNSGSIFTVTIGFGIWTQAATDTASGVFSILNITGNTWVASGVLKINTGNTNQTGGDVALASALTQLRITTVNGTDTFDAGSINILYE